MGREIAKSYGAMVNDYLGIESYKVIDEQAGTADTEYYKSDYYKSKGVYDDVRMRENSLALTKQADIEGATLLWNNNDALPLAKGNKISIFGYSQKKWALSGWGSGHVAGATTRKNLKDTLEEKEFQVNDTLWKAYGAVSGGWGVGPAVAGIPTYYEYDVREPGWSTINSTSYGNVSSSVEQYGDAAIMIISRLGSENGDLDFASDECIDECYLNPSYQDFHLHPIFP